MKIFFRKYKTHLLIGVFFIVFLPFSLWYASRLIGLVSEDVSQKQHFQIQQEIQDEMTTNPQQLQNQVDTIKANRDKIDILLGSSDDENIELYSIIEETAESLGHQKTTIAVEQYIDTTSKKDDKNVSQNDTLGPAASEYLYLHISTISTYNEALSFLHKLDNLPYLSDVLIFDIKTFEASPSSVRQESEEEQVIGENLVKSNFYVAFYYDEQDKDGAYNKEINQVNSTSKGAEIKNNIDPAVVSAEGEGFSPMQDGI